MGCSAYFETNLRRHRALLRSTLECQYGLLVHLVSLDVLSDEQVSDIQRDNRTPFELNDRLIDIMSHVIDELKIENFLVSLRATNQTHLAKYLLQNIYDDAQRPAASCDHTDDEVPLSEHIRTKIRRLTSYLVEHLDLQNGLLDLLYSVGCLNDYHRTSLNGGGRGSQYGAQDLKRNLEFLDILKRRSVSQYRLFLDCLRLPDVRQGHIADVLEGSGALVSIDVVISPSTEQLPGEQSSGNGQVVNGQSNLDLQRKIVELFKLLQTENDKQEVINKLIGISQPQLLSATDGHSIRFYFRCLTLGELHVLRDIVESGQLRLCVEHLIRKLLTRIDHGGLKSSDDSNTQELIEAIPVRVLYVYLIDYCACEEELITGMADAEINSTKKPTLPSDLWEQIVSKAFLFSHVNAFKTMCAKPEQRVYQSLAPVCASWRLTASRRPWFKELLRKRLSNRKEIRVKFLERLNTDREVQGVVHLRNKIFIISPSSNTILVYDAATLQRRDDVILKLEGVEPIDAWDLASCSVSGSLYISDYSNRCIWRLMAEQEKLQRWLETGPTGVLQSLSVTSLGHVLLLDQKPPELHVYGPDAILLRTIPLPSDIQNPHHVIETKTGNYIISHGLMESELHRVSEVTKAGRLVRSFGGRHADAVETGHLWNVKSQGDFDPTCHLETKLLGVVVHSHGIWEHGQRKAGHWERGQINYPVHMACDLGEGWMFVADYSNGRVLILDLTLALRRVIDCGWNDNATLSSKFRPYRLCYTAQHHRLLVGLGSGGVNVYKVTAFR